MCVGARVYPILWATLSGFPRQHRMHGSVLSVLAVVFPVITALLLAPALPSAAQETWTPTSTVGAPSARTFHTAVWTGSKMIVYGGTVLDVATYATTTSGGIYDPATNDWTATPLTNAPMSRSDHTAVWTGSRLIVWGGYSSQSPAAFLNTGGVYDPANDTWTATSTTDAPTGRTGHTAVWTGSKMIVWGGFESFEASTNTGALYDPATDTWTAMSATNAPSGRGGHTALWTGSRMVVWGGNGSSGGAVNTGGLYDPATDTWSATSTTEAPAIRYNHTAVWTGSRLIVWGGYNYESPGLQKSGGIYDPATDTWTATTLTSAPSAREYHTAVWTGSRMIVWGGWWQSYLNTGGIYDPATDTWTETSVTGAPEARFDHTAVWADSRMIIWAGQGSVGNSGGVYANPGLPPAPSLPVQFYTVTPCRFIDTRGAIAPAGGPALFPGATRSFPVAGGVCGIPSTATAVSVNVTAVQPTAAGYLTLYRGDVTSPPPTSSINLIPGVTRANNAVVTLAASGTLNVKNGSTGWVHLVLDVNGYFQ